MTIAISGTNGITLDGQFNSASSMGFKNRIINGAMVIDQRNAGASVTINSPSSTYTLDRWRAFGQTSDGVFTVQQSSTAPSGFINSLLATVTTADASIGSTQFYTIQQAIEGLNLYDLGFGTASAKTVTISFQVRSSVTGTFSGSLKNSDGTRSYPFTYAINAANTWEQKSVTIVGDTSGTWLTTNGTGVTLTISLGSGSSRLATADAWAAGNYDGATGATTLISTNGATFYITGVQLEKGSTATSFDYRPYGTELQLCQRYFQTYVNANGACIPANGVFRSGSRADVTQVLPVVMRSAPTIATTNIGNINVYSGGSAGAASAFADNGSNANTVAINISASGTEGRGVYLQASGATAGYTLSSEL